MSNSFVDFCTLKNRMSVNTCWITSLHFLYRFEVRTKATPRSFLLRCETSPLSVPKRDSEGWSSRATQTQELTTYPDRAQKLVVAFCSNRRHQLSKR